MSILPTRKFQYRAIDHLSLRDSTCTVKVLLVYAQTQNERTHLDRSLCQHRVVVSPLDHGHAAVEISVHETARAEDDVLVAVGDHLCPRR